MFCRGVYSFPVLSSTWLSLPYQDGGRSSWWEIQEHSQQKQRPLGAAHLGDQVREAGGRVRTGQRLTLRCGRERRRSGPVRRPFPSSWPPQPLPRACGPAGRPPWTLSFSGTGLKEWSPRLSFLGARSWRGSLTLKAGSLGCGQQPGAGVLIHSLTRSRWPGCSSHSEGPAVAGLPGASPKSPGRSCSVPSCALPHLWIATAILQLIPLELARTGYWRDTCVSYFCWLSYSRFFPP